MSDQPINSKTIKAIDSYLTNPGQSVGLLGQKWLNKAQIAKYLAEKVLGLNPGELANYPYALLVSSGDAKTIGIDEIRSISEFIVLKVPNDKPINRVVIIEGAERLTLEAQNALLKNLEEPPKGSIFILTAEASNSLLPTIISRLNIINVHKPATDELNNYYLELGYKPEDIKQAQLISDGLPGLLDQLLTDKDNAIHDALDTARGLLSSTTFERLSSISELSKDKIELNNVLFVIKQMAKIGVTSSDIKSANRWRKILKATLESETKLQSNAQVKLLLTDYILNIA